MTDPTATGLSVEHIAVKRHRDLMRFLRRRVRATDAQDLAQDVYCGLLRLERKEYVRDPMAYVYTVAANAVRAHREKLQQQANALKQFADEMSLRGPRRSEELNVDATLTGRKVRAVLDELSPSCRAIVILHRRDGMTYEEISELLGVSTAVVKKWLGLSVRHCHNRLQEYR
jgi:RNA polymerase sigma factor (sigma-70 family)